MGGLIAIGTPTPEEFWRIILLLSLVFLCGILVEYIYFVFSLLSSSCNFCVGFGCSLVVFQRVLCNDSRGGYKALSPSGMVSVYHQISYQKFILGLMRLAPSELFNEATTTLLMPSIRSLGPLTMEQLQEPFPVRYLWEKV